MNKQLTEYVPKEVLDYAPEMPEIPKVDVKEFIPNVDLSFTSDIRGLWNKGKRSGNVFLPNLQPLIHIDENLSIICEFMICT